MLSTPLQRLTHLGAFAICVLVAAGCASVGAPARTETLGPVDALAVRPDGIRAWRLASADLYEEACVRPDLIDVGDVAALNEAESRLLQSELAEALRASFAESGLQTCELPSRARSLVVRANITALERADPAVNAITALLLLAPLSRGGITVELEAVDAHGGHRVAAMAFRGRAGVADVGSAFSELGHARAQVRIAAARFADVVIGSPTRSRHGAAGLCIPDAAQASSSRGECVTPVRAPSCLDHEANVNQNPDAERVTC
jgi:hypothetical protein